MYYMSEPLFLSDPVTDEEDVEADLEGEVTPDTEAKLEHSVKFTLKYSYSLLHALISMEENFVTSPIVSLTSIGALILGSEGQTRDELTRTLFDVVLRTDSDEYLLVRQLRGCLEAVAKGCKEADRILRIPSYLYISSDYQTCDSFKEFADHFFGVTVKECVFARGVEKKINEAIHFDSDGRVGAVLNEVGEGIRMILICATYFCAPWKNGFCEIRRTMFTNIDGSAVEIDAMYGYGKFRLGFNDMTKCHVLELPYALESTKMLIFLPQKETSFDDLIRKTGEVHSYELASMMDTSRYPYRDVEICLPKFRIETTVSLKNFLRGLGVRSAFKEKRANFERIVRENQGTDHYGLFLGECIDKTIVEVTDAGTRTLTLNDMVAKNKDSTDIFRCNRPFMFTVVTDALGQEIVVCQGAVKVMVARS